MVVLSGDVHSKWLNDLHLDYLQPNTPVLGTEFVGTLVTSRGNGPAEMFHDHQRGYLRCTVTPREWRTESRVVDDVERPGGKVSTVATYVVASGKPGAVKAWSYYFPVLPGSAVPNFSIR